MGQGSARGIGRRSASWLLGSTGALLVAAWCTWVAYPLIELLRMEAEIHADYLAQLSDLSIVLGRVALETVGSVLRVFGRPAAPVLIVGVLFLGAAWRLGKGSPAPAVRPSA